MLFTYPILRENLFIFILAEGKEELVTSSCGRKHTKCNQTPEYHSARHHLDI